MPENEVDVDVEFADLFTATERDSPLILHAPHGGRTIPERFRASFVVSADELEAEKDRMTDHFTGELVASITGASSVVNHLSRLVVDVERFPDETEEMNQVGMGVLYTHGSQRQEIRRPSALERGELLAFFDTYSRRFTELVDETLARHGRAVILDVHSYPQHPLPYELHSESRRPQLCIGFEPFHAPDALLDAVRSAFADLEQGDNGPFAGSYVPLKHYRKDARVQSVMLEVRRDVYMDEESGSISDGRQLFVRLREHLQRLVDAVGCQILDTQSRPRLL
ncbi:N-formylglutamate amidohydrolase [Salinibacterium sp. SYSU T00001]|uniref:N-formylglutamate amidohydrolase n=1 Tax=Homoserinimonas sedimenticola TaxID=2986805 RepID=UPI002235BB73|nr:N-formylglutamate amidohydrolase [Salinibacterium sedimenticola]MCW4386334.1 N-formylglutamate amidohydrolase [Salinibacterium sedimenticola]